MLHGVRGDEEPVRSGPAVPPASAGDARSGAAALESNDDVRGDEEPVRSGSAVPPYAMTPNYLPVTQRTAASNSERPWVVSEAAVASSRKNPTRRPGATRPGMLDPFS
jgi:hypothetical protein